MIPHWDLIPGEDVTLASPTGIEKEAVFISRDTLHACFQLKTTKNEVRRMWFKLSEEGYLRDVMERRWHVKGQRKSTGVTDTGKVVSA